MGLERRRVGRLDDVRVDRHSLAVNDVFREGLEDALRGLRHAYRALLL